MYNCKSILRKSYFFLVKYLRISTIVIGNTVATMVSNNQRKSSGCMLYQNPKLIVAYFYIG
jgi:hypothetical protein